MISVIIPILNQLDLTKQLFDCIYKNTVLPSEIILIDNASREDFSNFPQIYEKLNIKYIKNEVNIGVNEAWNLGISIAKYNYVSILNSDIKLSSSFFKKVIDSFQKFEDVGIVVPNTLKDLNENLENNNEEPTIKDLGKREGWAFTIRKEILDQIKPIPSELKYFFGDDYLFTSSSLCGYRNVKIMNNFIYHYGSTTVKSEISKYKNIMKLERVYWEKIVKNLTIYINL